METHSSLISIEHVLDLSNLTLNIRAGQPTSFPQPSTGRYVVLCKTSHGEEPMIGPWTMKLEDFFTKPSSMTDIAAVLHTTALLQAASILHDYRLDGSQRIIVIGGETPLGAAMIQLCKDANIYVTAVMDDQEELFQRVSQLMRFGASYAIDGAAPDLGEYLSTIRDEDCDVILVKTTDEYDIRPEILQAVEGRCVEGLDCAKIDLGEFDLRLSWDEVGELLKDAAEIFATYQEPPSCGFEPKKKPK